MVEGGTCSIQARRIILRMESGNEDIKILELSLELESGTLG